MYHTACVIKYASKIRFPIVKMHLVNWMYMSLCNCSILIDNSNHSAFSLLWRLRHILIGVFVFISLCIQKYWFISSSRLFFLLCLRLGKVHPTSRKVKYSVMFLEISNYWCRILRIFTFLLYCWLYKEPILTLLNHYLT